MFRVSAAVVALALLSSSVPALAAPPVRATASAFSTDERGKHTADLAFDGLLQSGWGAGSASKGEGSWVEIDLGASTAITSLSIWPGNLQEGAKSYREYSRPRLITLSVDGKQVGEKIRIQDQVQRLDLPVTAQGRKVRITMDEVFEGYVYSDLYIAEVGVNWAEEVGKTNEKLQKWLDSTAGGIEKAAHTDAIKADYEAHKKAEFGNPEALARIMDACGDGAPYLRPQVLAHVPPGFRVAYLQPDPEALSALRKLKDANSIPAIEMASLRVKPAKQKEFAELVEIFYAWQQLVGGPDPNVPYWGKSGWAQGALQSFGEPLAMDIDRFGMVYVADTGNNRVQRYAEDGRPERVWGGEPGITNLWFERGRKWYVSGSEPGTDKSRFQNPLDVVVIPEGKATDSFAVIDARGRIQLFDPEGNPRIGWKLRSDSEVEPGLGGEAYLAWLPKKKMLYAIWGDEAIGFNLQGEELTRWDIKDGTPNAVVVDKKGKLLFAYRDEIIKYDPDGFRFGKIQDESSLLPGFEDVDLAIDEDGKLWMVIDTGWVFKFKKPGKVDFKVEVADYSLERPRLAVRDDMIYVCERDAIKRLDTRQLLLDAAEKAKQEAEEQAAGTGAP